MANLGAKKVCLPQKNDEKFHFQLAIKLQLSRKLFLPNLKTLKWSCNTDPSRIPIPSTIRYRGAIPSSHSAQQRSAPYNVQKLCEGEAQKHGRTCLLRITISFKFYLVLLAWVSVIGLNYVEYQKISRKFLLSTNIFYNQLRIAEMFYSV